jgi:hypothetical protein
VDRPSIILAKAGGWAYLFCWRDDIGAVPSEALFTCPPLGIDKPQRATIYRDGRVRARLNAGAIMGKTGDFVCTWLLKMPILNNVLPDDCEPEYEDIEVPSSVTITNDPALVLDPSAYWADADGLPTPMYLREKYLFGVPPLDAEGRTLPDSALQGSIDAAVRRVENRLAIKLRQRVWTAGLPTYPPQLDANGDPRPVETEPPYDYDPSKFRVNYGFMALRNGFVSEVLSMQVWVADRMVAEIPKAWIKLSGKRGHIQLMPGALGAATLPGSIALPVVMGLYGGSVVPHVWHIAYKAGCPVDPSIFEVISWIANQIMFIIISDSLIAGVASQSTSIDGISESITLTASAENSTYAANIKEIDKRIETFFKEQGDTYTGIRMSVV